MSYYTALRTASSSSLGFETRWRIFGFFKFLAIRRFDESICDVQSLEAHEVRMATGVSPRSMVERIDERNEKTWSESTERSVIQFDG